MDEQSQDASDNANQGEPDFGEQIGDYDEALQSVEASEGEQALRRGCGSDGCALAGLVLLVGSLFFVLLFGSSFFDGDPDASESPSGTQTGANTGSGAEDCPEGGPSTPGSAIQVAFAADDSDPCPVDNGNGGPPPENQLNALGNLVPIPGDWLALFGAGTMTCALDTPIQASTDEAFLEVLDDGERIVLTDSNGSVTLDRQTASPTEAVYYVDLSEQAGMDWQQTLVFTSSNTVEIQIFGCPEREGEGYLVEAADGPSPDSGGEGSSGQGEASTTGLLESCTIDVGPNLTEPQLDELVDCFEPYTGVSIVEGLPDVEGSYFTAEGITTGYGGDLSYALQTCSVSDGDFSTNTMVGAIQVWLGIQNGDNLQMGAMITDEQSNLTHNYESVDYEFEVRANRSPGENEWAGWTIFETLMYNKADFFPYTEESFGGSPAYDGRITLVCG